MHHLGATRSSLKHDHLLQTPDTFVRTPLPGATGVEFIVHAASPNGRELYPDDGRVLLTVAPSDPRPAQRFLYVLEGELDLTNGGIASTRSRRIRLFPAGDADHSVTAHQRRESRVD